MRFFIILSNYESLLSYDVNKELKEKIQHNKYSQKVNKSISLNTIKQKSFELFYSNKHIDKILKNMCCERSEQILLGCELFAEINEKSNYLMRIRRNRKK